MRGLYIGSRALSEQGLLLEKEVTALQRRFTQSVGEPVEFVFLPAVLAEDLPIEIIKHEPEILHISTHGDKDGLSFSNSGNNEVKISHDTLNAIFHNENPPRLVYINACDSDLIAEKLTGRVSMAVGTTAPISNRAALTGAISFYDRLIRGFSVKDAFEASSAIIEALDNKCTKSHLAFNGTVQPEFEILHYVPRLIAKFHGKFGNEQSKFSIELGVHGCPKNTHQMVFYTDDDTFVDDDKEFEETMVSIYRGYPRRGVIWSEETWAGIEGNFKCFASGVSPGGQAFVVAGELCNALELYYSMTDDDARYVQHMRAVARLRAQDGSGLSENDGKAFVKRN
ncbi:hypothetical protein [Paludibacterium sp.]|uniref:hypothetical protein n=1 Tax=Paludibacterium sp. TaxID=1917523 RepID=UPI0025DD2763|nr:hypothetical protein [Paludibacterium sp.]MBV8649528.1 hypothetical protein [Paludibacterium sp.]